MRTVPAMLWLSLCASTAQASEIYSAYLDAVEDAALAHRVEERPLAKVEGDVVRVAAWAGAARYTVGETTLAADVWVTIVPEFKDACSTAEPRTALRFEQLLGLPPGDGKADVVEFDVPRAALFRPCAEPSIDQDRCRAARPGEAVDADHRAWFGKTMVSSYTTDGTTHPYPWTRLGYTYDWAPGAEDVVGLTELVIRRGTKATVVSVAKTEAYCGAFRSAAGQATAQAPLESTGGETEPEAAAGGSTPSRSGAEQLALATGIVALCAGLLLLIAAALVIRRIAKTDEPLGMQSNAGFGGGLGGVRLNRQAARALLALLLVAVGAGLVSAAAAGAGQAAKGETAAVQKAKR